MDLLFSMEDRAMDELTVQIKYNNNTFPFSAFDVQKALEHLFGINTDFEVKEVNEHSIEIPHKKEKPRACKCELAPSTP